VKTVGKLLCPRQTDQADTGVRQNQAQCAKCRHGAKHVAKPHRAKDNEFFYAEMLDRPDIACILCKGIRKCQGEFPDSDLSGVTVKQQEEFAAELTQFSCHHSLQRVKIACPEFLAGYTAGSDSRTSACERGASRPDTNPSSGRDVKAKQASTTREMKQNKNCG
jgi:hypothetical protein